MKPQKSGFFLFAFILTVLGMFLHSCNRSEGKSVSQTERYNVIHPVRIDTFYQDEYVADIHAVQKVEIRTRLKGFIEQIHVDEGQPVSAGQLLFTLSSKSFQDDLLKANAQLKSATAELKAVEVELKNVKQLVEKEIVSKSEQELVQAKKESILAKIDEANSSISIARLNLSYTQIRAPFVGVINRIPNKKGSLVEEGTLLTSITDNKEVYAYFKFSENDYLNFILAEDSSHKSTVGLRLANQQIYAHRGVIEVSESEFDQSSGNIAFRARFINPDGLLKHGSSAKVIIDKALRNVLFVPQRSTFELQDKVFVYVVDEKQIVRQRNIVIGKRLPHYYVVESGLSANETIVFEGIENLKDGQKITPVKPNKPVHLTLNK
jgi:membrane fusion protein (multidrug efflux system)